MNKYIKVILPIFVVMIFNTFGMFAHSPVVNAHSEHQSAQTSNVQSLSCASLCLSLPGAKSEDEGLEVDKDDNDPYESPDFRKLLEPVSFEYMHSARAALASSFEPPPGPSTYVLNSVFRF